MPRCNCFEEMLDKVKEHIAPKIPAGAIDVNIDWDGRTFVLSKGEYAPVNPKVKIEYRAPKKAGGHTVNLKKDTVTMTASYCCYCGNKYEREEKEQNHG
jgi:hypothetical protein